MSQPIVLATGLNGLVGTRCGEVLGKDYAFQNLDLSHPTAPVDILNAEMVNKVIGASPASHVLHLAAFTDVNKAWEQSGDKNGLVYQVNVVGTRNLVQACQTTGKHLIHTSTSFVFGGDKNGLYTETDPVAPIEWYGQTKAWAEEEVQKSSGKWTVLRIDQPFRTEPFSKIDTAHRVAQGLKDGSLYPQFTSHFFGPTWIDDFAKVVDWVIKTSPTGIFHASSGEQWTDFDFAVAIQEALHLPTKVQPGDLDAYLKTAKRPYHRNTAMSIEKLKQESGLKFTPIRQVLSKLEISV